MSRIVKAEGNEEVITQDKIMAQVSHFGSCAATHVAC